ncbi:HAMP domain-containing histidine kinase [Patescibacteria group bacterium]|nr:HAMP domain-containing histidine kinase [Patescibacteria group bacterium]MBU1123927.1 HAMP domain-containing histidine kinase [Patescibacteria group bacterium]MBU1911508.1 HAMP domain-containing histidine kinase [Patescibacteria group bacterium]
MFDKLRFRIALQFTIVIFILLLIYGAIFIPIDYRDYKNELEENLTNDASRVLSLMDLKPEDAIRKLTERDDFRVRIFNADDIVVYSGQLFTENDNVLRHDPFKINYHNDRFFVMTFPIELHGIPSGSLQIGEVYHVFIEDLREKMIILFLESLLVALLTYFIGMFFAKRALAPAESMYKRLDQFSQDASHELKTPLANASSSLDLALIGEKPRKYVEEAKINIIRAAEIVDDLLELAKMTKFTLQKEEINLSKLIREVIKEFNAQARFMKVRFITQIADDISVEADPGYILLLISNLINNSLKFSESGGEVQIILDEHSIQIRDKGIGIDSNMIERLFDPFFQAESSHSTKGSGLGLSIVKKIVDAHEWMIDVQSIKGIGTSFSITFK